MRMFMTLLLALSVFVPAAWAEANGPDYVRDLPHDQTCVGYRTTKGMLFVANVEVIGTNCKAQVTFAADEQEYAVAVTIPTNFDSGNGRRDRHVAQLLGETVVFQARVRKELVDSAPQAFEMPGTLHIRGTATPVVLRVVRDSAHGSYAFVTATRFSVLGLAVPKVGPGGAIASPTDDVVLFGRLEAGRVPGPIAKE